MARPARVDAPGLIHHVHNRGARRQSIFFDDRDRRSFLWHLGDAASRFGAVIHAYCLMGNHYHLLVGTHQGDLDRFMQSSTSRYVKKFNWRHGLDGPMFRDRYTNHPIEDTRYLFTAARYIHANPIDIPGVDVATYGWSSLKGYLEARFAPSWLTTDLVLEAAGGDRDLYLKQVLAYVDQPSPDASELKRRLSTSPRVDQGIVLEQVFALTEQLMFCTRGQILATGDRRTNKERLLACHLAMNGAGLPETVVAEALQFATVGGLWRALQRFNELAETDPVLAAMAAQAWRLMPSAEAA